MATKKVIRCQSDKCGKEKSNILFAYDENSIYIKCRDWDCKRWSKLSFVIPGAEIDLSKCGIVHEILPENYHLHIEPGCSTVVE
jgi:hypothetical protein